MEIYQTWHGIKQKYPETVVGLGNFDGVHLGHQKIITELVRTANRIKGSSLIFTFHPHPEAVLNPENAPLLLLTQKAKENIIARLGVDVLLRVPFTIGFARLEPEEFIEEVLCLELGVRAIFVGYNYTFGYKGRGTAGLLKEYSLKYGYELHVIPPVVVEGQVVSSTLIRELLREGKVTEAAKYLGYFPFVEGKVVVGDRRGSILGFPTANLEPEDEVLVPANGVYSVRVEVDGSTFLGVANIGVRPTFYGPNARPNVEVHLLDFYGNLYGKFIRVYFIRKLREEKRFNSIEELIAQINLDIARVRDNA